MKPVEMLKEWHGGCTCAGPMHDRLYGLPPETTSPADCEQCTQGLLDALEHHYREKITFSALVSIRARAAWRRFIPAKFSRNPTDRKAKP